VPRSATTTGIIVICNEEGLVGFYKRHKCLPKNKEKKRKHEKNPYKLN